MESCQPIDPRIRRTRLLLQEALEKLLEKKGFDKISVQDIVEGAAINRATFYDHYSDKFALLECVVGSRFHELLYQQGVVIEGPCTTALRRLVVGLCAYLDRMLGPESERRLDPHMERAIVAVLRRMLVEGFRNHASERAAAPEIAAATVSGAIYGAAREWAETPGRTSPEEFADVLLQMIAPMFQTLQKVGAEVSSASK